MTERTRIDPTHKYGDEHDGLLQVERRAVQVLEDLGEPPFERTRDAFEFTVHALGAREGTAGVDSFPALLLLVTSEALELRVPVVEWTRGAYAPILSSRLSRRTMWTTVGGAPGAVASLVERAVARRRRALSTCRACGRRIPFPGWRGGECNVCAEESAGRVY